MGLRIDPAIIKQKTLKQLVEDKYELGLGQHAYGTLNTIVCDLIAQACERAKKRGSTLLKPEDFDARDDGNLEG